MGTGETNQPKPTKNRGFVLMKSASKIHQLFGVFDRGTLMSIDWTLDDANLTARRLSSTDAASSKIPEHPSPHFVVRNVFVLEMDLASHMLFEMRSALEEAVHRYRVEEKNYEKIIDEAARSKSSFPDNMWVPKHTAWLKMEALKRIVSSLEEQAIGSKFSLGA